MASRTRKSTPVVPAAEVGKSGYALAQKRTPEEWEALVLSTYVPALQGGATMQSLREVYGRSTPARQAMIRLGLGTPADIRRGSAPSRNAGSIKVKGVRKDRLAKSVAARRQNGVGWNALTLETGMARDELTALLKQHGHGDLVSGRVITSERTKARIAKEAAAQAAAEARKATRKPRARRAKATA